MNFIVYAVLFAFALVMTVREAIRRSDASAYFILAAYLLLSLFIQLHWNQAGNPFNNRFIS